MKKITGMVAALALTISPAVYADVYDPATNQLTITSVVVGDTTYTDVVITVGDILSVGGSTSSTQPSQISSLAGTYRGISNGAIFGTDSTNITVEVVGTSLMITAAQFFDGTCQYSATITSSGSTISDGTYQCSDFTNGTWTLNQIRLIDTDDIYISLTSSARGLKEMYGMRN